MVDLSSLSTNWMGYAHLLLVEPSGFEGKRGAVFVSKVAKAYDWFNNFVFGCLARSDLVAWSVHYEKANGTDSVNESGVLADTQAVVYIRLDEDRVFTEILKSDRHSRKVSIGSEVSLVARVKEDFDLYHRPNVFVDLGDSRYHQEVIEGKRNSRFYISPKSPALWFDEVLSLYAKKFSPSQR